MKFYDLVFSANARNASAGWTALAGFLTVEQLESLSAE